MTPKSDSKTAVKGTAVPALETAVILTSGLIFDEGPHHSRSGKLESVMALTQVGGLSLLQRTVLTLQRAGMTRLFVLADHNEEAFRSCLSDDPRITAQVRWLPVREFPPQDARTWEALAGDIHGACLVVGVHAVFSKGLIEHCREVQDERSIVTVAHPSDTSMPHQARAEMLVLPASLLCSSVGASTLVPGESPLRGIVNQALAEGRLRIVATAPGTACWYRAVRNGADVAVAERFLFRSLKSDLDGFIDTYFNRRVSGWLSRLFLKWGWSPNVITIFSILIGLTAALSVSLGSYVTGVMGALLFQLSAIVDCCDGDVARLTFQESRFGEQLDLYGDNLVHMAIFAGIAWAGYAQTHSFLPLGLGTAAILGNALSLWLVTRLKARQPEHHSSPLEHSRSDFIVKNIANRDFSVVVLLFALLNSLEAFLWLAAIGSNLFWLYTAWTIRPPNPRA